MTDKYTKRTQGFTLVELSIVIIIIGFLIAGISAGQSLVKQAANIAVAARQERPGCVEDQLLGGSGRARLLRR